MRRCLTVLFLLVGLILTAGCFSRPTEAQKITDRGALDRLKETATKDKAGKAGKGGGLTKPD
jgi:hypothetical protein